MSPYSFNIPLSVLINSPSCNKQLLARSVSLSFDPRALCKNLDAVLLAKQLSDEDSQVPH